MTATAQHQPEATESRQALRRQVGLFGATMMGLGSIIGTGVFVSIGIAAGTAGPSVILGIALAAVVATCNALSSAQLAASHPVSGGTYEYGYKYLYPWLGFTAGWMFLCAKVASAATAALGFSGYLLCAARVDGQELLAPLAVSAIALLTILVLRGIRSSSYVNIVVVSVTLVALGAFCLSGMPSALSSGSRHLIPFFVSDVNGTQQSGAAPVLHAAALMFVAFAGYGRIATLGEEVQEPRRTIPRAIVLTLVVSALLYVAVAVVGIAAVGANALYGATESRAAPLEVAARQFGLRGVSWLVAAGAVTAMLGVLLNLILGLSRVLLAMARRGDMPRVLGRLNESQTTPYYSVLLVGGIIAILAGIGTVKTTWSFSAFTILIHYSITNLAALRLTGEQRLYSPLWAYGGLLGCLFLAFWVEATIWLAGLGLIAAGLAWHVIAGHLAKGR